MTSFEEMQPQLFQVFNRAIQHDKLGHAYLFAGDFGMVQAALYLAQATYCLEPHDGGLPCGQCRNCLLVADNDYMDLHWIKPDGKFIKTDQIRDLSEVFYGSGYESDKQVIIIEDADKMNVQAANSLLKVIEEPTGQVMIIFITNNLHLMLDTIKSRTQIVAFPSHPDQFAAMLDHENLLPSTKRVITNIARNLEEAHEMAASTNFANMVQACQGFADLLGNGDKVTAFLKVPSLVAQLDGDKVQQEQALRVLLYLFTQARNTTYILNTFQAMKFFNFNVNAQSCLEYIVLGEGTYAL
jgi:DNA polymerase-3 subunit delta'